MYHEKEKILDHKTILKKIKLCIQLMELHDENPFKIRSYQSALNSLERGDADIMEISESELSKIPGVGKSILEAIVSLKETETFSTLDELIEKTPEGILEVLQIKGLGPKKVKTLWEELGITSTHELMEACQSGKVAKIKGFGEKTQETIIQNLEFKASNAGKWLYADVEESIESLTSELQKSLNSSEVVIVGDFARKMEIIASAEWLIGTSDISQAKSQFKAIEAFELDKSLSSPFVWRGKVKDLDLNFGIHFSDLNNYPSKKYALSASAEHLKSLVDEKETIAEKLAKNGFKNDEEFFSQINLQFIPVEMREGYDEVSLAKEQKIPTLLEEKDLKGILHNHSTYSDGKHSLRQMAEYCKELGYEYLGISDHSRTASYAGGLEIEKVQKQHEEIDQLNKELAPFKIFKGIESDILGDGSLDYPEDVLKSFDFIVSSVHSILNMDIKRATKRLLTAIENPYTTILGHPTGRLLLRREGYPIDHKTIIDACAKNKVVIEINANPWRLDLDWRWVRYAMDQGVMLSINPDAHEMDGYADMKYGVLVGRKGGLTKEMTLNALSLKEIQEYFDHKKG
ncbi:MULTISPECIES: DNA polymerase/3'-5' exonuclease PolX [unclassified Algoriphagus]|jgi:DNA polymerase (family 10)|uniref:DNA polymerase/3'-5' exonuclease PolX n=2 Tax=Algoriphagus TaxID=246875 RepID=UPI002107C390|nr:MULTISPECIES: DNA polymerase/3'-5' exonuclease PolX [unclassified Algoriphagus]|tara:strand:+ start:3987 stop:5705 length:1719 start_codon:yes stop_codon:yes gene_type:complete